MHIAQHLAKDSDAEFPYVQLRKIMTRLSPVTVRIAIN